MNTIVKAIILTSTCFSFNLFAAQKAQPSSEATSSAVVQTQPPLTPEEVYEMGYSKGYNKGAIEMTKELRIGQYALVDTSGFKEIREVKIAVEICPELEEKGIHVENIRYQLESQIKSAGLILVKDSVNPVKGGTISISVGGGFVPNMGFQIFVSTHFIQTAHLLRQNEKGKFHFFISPVTTWSSQEFRKFSNKPVPEVYKAVEDQLHEMLLFWKQANT